MRKESNIEVKNQMHDYLADLMEDSFNFGLNDAKRCHTVPSFKIEKGKIDWCYTDMTDLVHKIHAQNYSHVPNGRYSDKPTTFKSYQNGTCGRKLTTIVVLLFKRCY